MHGFYPAVEVLPPHFSRACTSGKGGDNLFSVLPLSVHACVVGDMGSATPAPPLLPCSPIRLGSRYEKINVCKLGSLSHSVKLKNIFMNIVTTSPTVRH